VSIASVKLKKSSLFNETPVIAEDTDRFFKKRYAVIRSLPGSV
jgi:hypothetical protein